MVGVGRYLCGSSSSTLLNKQHTKKKKKRELLGNIQSFSFYNSANFEACKNTQILKLTPCVKGYSTTCGESETRSSECTDIYWRGFPPNRDLIPCLFHNEMTISLFNAVCHRVFCLQESFKRQLLQKLNAASMFFLPPFNSVLKEQMHGQVEYRSPSARRSFFICKTKVTRLP